MSLLRKDSCEETAVSRTKSTFRVSRKKHNQQGDRGVTEARKHLDSERQEKQQSRLRGAENSKEVNKNKD